MQYVIPFLAPWSVALTAVFLWWWQTVFKRRMEIAERAMLAFDKAEEGLMLIRSPALSKADEEMVVVPDNIPDDGKAKYRRIAAFFLRIDKHADKFTDLSPAQTLSRIHIGQEAADALQELLQVRHAIWGMANALTDSTLLRGWNEDQKSEMWWMENSLYQTQSDPEKPNEIDKLTPQIFYAKAKLERACEPYFSYPFVRWFKKKRKKPTFSFKVPGN